MDPWIYSIESGTKLLVFVGPYVGLTQPYVGGVYTCWSNQGCDVTKDPLHPFLG